MFFWTLFSLHINISSGRLSVDWSLLFHSLSSNLFFFILNYLVINLWLFDLYFIDMHIVLTYIASQSLFWALRTFEKSNISSNFFGVFWSWERSCISSFLDKKIRSSWLIFTNLFFRKWKRIYEVLYPTWHNYVLWMQALFQCIVVLLHTNSSSFVILIDEVCMNDSYRC